MGQNLSKILNIWYQQSGSISSFSPQYTCFRPKAFSITLQETIFCRPEAISLVSETTVFYASRHPPFRFSLPAFPLRNTGKCRGKNLPKAQRTVSRTGFSRFTFPLNLLTTSA